MEMNQEGQEGTERKCADLAHRGEFDYNRPGGGFCVQTLARLSPNAIIDTQALASAFGMSARTVRRMVAKGELPPGIPLGRRRVWFAGKIIDHFVAEADRRLTADEKTRKRREKFTGVDNGIRIPNEGHNRKFTQKMEIPNPRPPWTQANVQRYE